MGDDTPLPSSASVPAEEDPDGVDTDNNNPLFAAGAAAGTTGTATPPSSSSSQPPPTNSDAAAAAAAAPEAPPQSPLYPGTAQHDRDDALLRQQLRYRFREHAPGLAWKAMRRCGWTYRRHGGSSGIYVSPRNTREFAGLDELRAQLDEPAVEPLRSSLQEDPGDEPMETAVEQEEDGKESINDLRNTIIYHMQKLIEESKRKRSSSNGTASGSKATNSRRDDDEDTSDTDGDDDDDDHDDDKKPAAAVSARPRRSNRRTLKSAAAAAANYKSVTATEKGTDLYLHRKSKRRQKPKAAPPSSSNSDITSIVAEDLTFPTLDECRERMRAFDASECDRIELHYRQRCFAPWRHLLSTNHSLLLYGHGSKRALLADFAERELAPDGPALQIDGFHPDCTVDGILDLLVALFLDGAEPPAGGLSGLQQQPEALEDAALEDAPGPPASAVVERAAAVARALARERRTPVYLVVHSLDGLRTARAQDALAALVRNAVGRSGAAALRLVASLDHVDASAALWSATTVHRFRWIWRQVHTHRPYVEELALLENDEDAFLGHRKRSSRSRKRSLATKQEANALQVLKNLAARHSEIMQILAQLQLNQLRSSQRDHNNNNNNAEEAAAWVEFKTFLAECKTRFVVNKETVLRSMQSELKDHRLIASKTASTGTEYVTVPFSVDKLKEIIAYKRGDP